MSKLEQIVNDAEGFVIESAERERKTTEIGELIMNRLRKHDKVAYVRFASVYLDFKDVKEFMWNLHPMARFWSMSQNFIPGQKVNRASSTIRGRF